MAEIRRCCEFALRVPVAWFTVPPLIDPQSVTEGSPDRRRLLSVHAHPDDEASKGAGTVRQHVDAGGEAVLVTCTGGEAGDVLNPAMQRPEVEADLVNVRRRELEASTAAIGYDQVVMLGYRDSGMPDTPPNEHPQAFANSDLDEEVATLVGIIRRVRPQVILTYGDDQHNYPHPDHLRVHDITVPAFDRAGDASYHPEQGPAFTPSKMYYSVWSRRRIEEWHAKFLELGLESPYDAHWLERPSQDERITTHISVAGTYLVRRAALIAHATQIDPESPFWFGLPDDVAADIYPFEDYILAESRVGSVLPETDLYAGITDLS